jgi:crotonobetainyl-CoA:carnitine CoA-transferase CaiB-like acyl-CoA transferase
MAQAANGTSGLPRGNRDPERAPQGCYPCRGDDSWIAISVGSDTEWQALCAATDHPDWAEDPRFAGLQDRLAHHDELDRLLSDWTGAQTVESAVEALQGAKVPAGAVLNAAALHADPHLEARGYFQTPRQEPEAPRFAGFPFRLGQAGGVVRCGGPPLGEANRDIISGLLGRPEKDVRPLDLREVGTDFDVAGSSWGRSDGAEAPGASSPTTRGGGRRSEK